MITRDRPGARLLAATTLLFLLAVWVGGSLIVDAVVVPTAIQQLPRPHFIGFGAALFSRLNFLEAILGAVATLLAFAMGRRGWGGRARHVTATAMLLSMTVLVLLFLLWLTPTMLAKVGSLQRAGVDFANPADMPPARAAFRTFHAIYSMLDVAKILAGAGVLWMFAVRRGK